MSLWNFLVMMCVLFFAPMALDLEYNMADSAGTGIEAGDDLNTNNPPADSEAAARCLAKLRHCTYLYHIFVFLQLFNLINCRKDGPKDYNVFASFSHNWYFLAVLVGEFTFQFLVPAAMIRTASLNKREWGACLMVGATPLIVSVLLKCCKESWLEKFRGGPCRLVDERKAMNNALVEGYNRVG
jgi:hypothetical protein